LEKLIDKRGWPMTLRSAHGLEFLRLTQLNWAANKGLHNLLIEPSKFWQNSTNQSFNGKFRDECLAMNWFHSGAHDKVIVE
jgi:putative transposase